MTVHPLRPASHRCLGRPLPYQQANRPRAHLEAIAFRTPSLSTSRCRPVDICGISPPLGRLSPASRQIAHVLRTRSPLYSLPEGSFLVRLACMKHAASVRPEPGSNSPLEYSIRLYCRYAFAFGKLHKTGLFRDPAMTRFSHSTYTIIVKERIRLVSSGRTS